MLFKAIRSTVIAFVVAGSVAFFLGMRGISGIQTYLLCGLLGLLVSFGLNMLEGNRKVKVVPSAQRAAMLGMSPAPGTALVYVYRDTLRGALLGFDLRVDGRMVAQLKSPRFTGFALPAGEHTLSAGAGGFAGAQNKPAEITVSFADGETAVYLIRTVSGLTQNTLQFERQQARAALSKLAGMQMVAADSFPAMGSSLPTA